MEIAPQRTSRTRGFNALIADYNSVSRHKVRITVLTYLKSRATDVVPEHVNRSLFSQHFCDAIGLVVECDVHPDALHERNFLSEPADAMTFRPLILASCATRLLIIVSLYAHSTDGTMLGYVHGKTTQNEE